MKLIDAETEFPDLFGIPSVRTNGFVSAIHADRIDVTRSPEWEARHGREFCMGMTRLVITTGLGELEIPWYGPQPVPHGHEVEVEVRFL
jgi:hypothetical protein